MKVKYYGFIYKLCSQKQKNRTQSIEQKESNKFHIDQSITSDKLRTINQSNNTKCQHKIKQMILHKTDDDNDDGEQEGFIKAKQQFSIKCVSYSIPRQLRRTHMSKKLKPLTKLKMHSIESIKTSPFINHTIREKNYKSIIKQQREHIIFNGFDDKQVIQTEPNITFDANFPMGNLQVVTKRNTCHYEVFMRPDTNTTTHFQWFYFRVRVIKKKTVKFVVKNFIKATMLYSKVNCLGYHVQGLRPFYLSKKQGKKKFVQIPEDVSFKQDQQSDYFNLTFTFQFKHDMDEVYFCSQPPYGYEELGRAMQGLKRGRRFIIGGTILGNKIPYISFNNDIDSKVIGVAIARQHPGEAVGSWMMQGFMRQIDKMQLSKDIHWIIIPMVNVDGVQLGNNRTGILGHDFNRNWDIDQLAKQEKMFPQISGILNYVKKLKKKYPKKLKMFLDLHGHSSEQNVFTYGPEHPQKSDYFYLSRMFPEMIAKRNHNFKLSQSSYKINNDKKNAARSIMLNQLRIPFTYTIQCTFGVMNDKPIGEEEIITVGKDIALAANQFLEHAYLKDSHTVSVKLIEEMKLKYNESLRHQAEEYDSASESSMDTPDRKQFQMNIQSLLGQKQSKTSSIIKFGSLEGNNLSKLSYERHRRKNSQQNFGLKGGREFLLSDEGMNISKVRKRVSRVATQGANPEMFNECAYFPPVTRKKSQFQRVPIPDRFPSITKQIADIPQMMNMKQIQQRLFKMKNSRIGKKILVINAYGV